MANSWIIAADNKVASLVEAARGLGGTVTALVVDNVFVSGVDRVIRVAQVDDAPVEATAPAFAEAIAAEPGDVVFAPDTAAGRVLAGAVAARLLAPVLTNVTSLAPGRAEVSRFGGLSLEEVTFDSVVVVIAEGGAATSGDSVTAETVVGGAHAATVTAVAHEERDSVDLAAARRIVGAGLGFKAKEDLALAEALAEALEAEVACSRPLAEGSNWMPRDRYLGVSGKVVAPELYVAAGISGQIHHSAGVNRSEVIVAINDDEEAPIFEQADYAIVGDLYSVLPELTERLK